MKKVFLLLMVLLFLSCGEDGSKVLLDPYISTWGTPTTTTQENKGSTIFMVYTWNTSKGSAKLILSKSDGKWKEVRFTEY